MKSAKKYAIQSVELKHESKNIEAFISEYNFLKSENLETLEDISRYIDSTKNKITQLEQERSIADNKRRRAEPEEKQQFKDERKALTEHITPLTIGDTFRNFDFVIEAFEFAGGDWK